MITCCADDTFVPLSVKQWIVTYKLAETEMTKIKHSFDFK